MGDRKKESKNGKREEKRQKYEMRERKVGYHKFLGEMRLTSTSSENKAL